MPCLVIQIYFKAGWQCQSIEHSGCGAGEHADLPWLNWCAQVLAPRYLLPQLGNNETNERAVHSLGGSRKAGLGAAHQLQGKKGLHLQAGFFCELLIRLAAQGL